MRPQSGSLICTALRARADVCVCVCVCVRVRVFASAISVIVSFASLGVWRLRKDELKETARGNNSRHRSSGQSINQIKAMVVCSEGVRRGGSWSNNVSGFFGIFECPIGFQVLRLRIHRPRLFCGAPMGSRRPRQQCGAQAFHGIASGVLCHAPAVVCCSLPLRARTTATGSGQWEAESVSTCPPSTCLCRGGNALVEGDVECVFLCLSYDPLFCTMRPSEARPKAVNRLAMCSPHSFVCP